MPQRARQPGLQGQARLLGRASGSASGSGVPAPAVRDAVHVHVDADALGAAPGSAHAQVRHFGADAWQRHQTDGCVGDVAGPAIAQCHGGRLDVTRLGVMETDGPYQLVQPRRVDGQNVLQVESGRRGGLVRRQFRLQPRDCRRRGRVFGLRREHQRHERLEPLVARTGAPVGEHCASHGVHNSVRGGAVGGSAHCFDKTVDFCPVAGRLNRYVTSFFIFDLSGRLSSPPLALGGWDRGVFGFGLDLPGRATRLVPGR